VAKEHSQKDNTILFSQTCLINHEMLEGLSPKNDVIESNLDHAEIEVAENGPTTLISHLNDPTNELLPGEEESKIASPLAKLLTSRD